ncbi:MarR family winged helix-turn-helix transcriptional regulator [Brumimicrobium aurantiacum]|uniref:MarR family transcriptional regulator n=1 Tax=Brumimicrobium aurantiacum TaxID=1737063 RepID=A0A3E1EZW9_9FLAO|nr:MarR family transcriptional regulator [Brumimicrobium aurantiacum]RFC55104.1 MarR family transcriptional regulator [Brumimicrobium aurantiacum]
MKKIESIITANFKDIHHKVLTNIRYTSNHIGSYYHHQLEEYDLSMAQFNILRILRGAKKKLNIKTVKDRMIEKSPNTTRLIDKLISKKFVKRSKGTKDKRVVELEITQQGLDVLSQLDVQFEDNHFKNLTNEEAETLSYLLDKFRNQ